MATAQAKTITVARSGKADFHTVPEAVDSVRKAADSRQVIVIGNGNYRERLKIGKNTRNLTLRGGGGARIVFGMKSGDVDPVTGSKYGSTGPGRNTSKRVPWSRLLTKEKVEKITVRTMLAGDDGWDPTAP